VLEALRLDALRVIADEPLHVLQREVPSADLRGDFREVPAHTGRHHVSRSRRIARALLEPVQDGLEFADLVASPVDTAERELDLVLDRKLLLARRNRGDFLQLDHRGALGHEPLGSRRVVARKTQERECQAPTVEARVVREHRDQPCVGLDGLVGGARGLERLRNQDTRDRVVLQGRGPSQMGQGKPVSLALGVPGGQGDVRLSRTAGGESAHLERFAPLLGDALGAQTTRLKAFQDVLGAFQDQASAALVIETLKEEALTERPRDAAYLSLLECPERTFAAQLSNVATVVEDALAALGGVDATKAFARIAKQTLRTI